MGGECHGGALRHAERNNPIRSAAVKLPFMRISIAPQSGATANTRIHGRWLLIARLAWVGVALLAVTLFVAGLPIQYQRLATVCPTSTCHSGQLHPPAVRALQSLGLSLGFFAGFALTLIVIFALVYGVVAVVIFWRRSDDRMALFVSLALLLFGLLTFNGVANALAEAYPVWWLPVACLTYLGSAAFILFLFLFPDGHFVPSWTCWMALAWNAQQIPGAFFPHAPITASSGFTAVSIV